MPRRQSMWARDGLFVTLVRGDDGGLRFEGQHLADGQEYEYFLTVAAADLPTIAVALGGGPSDDVIDLLVSHAWTVIPAGERNWLEGLGITPGFWSHGDVGPGSPGLTPVPFAGLAAELAAHGFTAADIVLPGHTDAALPVEGALALSAIEDGFELVTVDYGRPYPLGRAASEVDARALVLGYVSRQLPPPGTITAQDVNRLTAGAAQSWADLHARASGSGSIVLDLPPHLPLDRVGALDGVHLSPYGTPFEHRSLPPLAMTPESRLHRFITTQPVRVAAAVVPAWFGQPGGGLRLTLQAPWVGIRELVVSGTLQRMQVTG